MTFLDMVRRLGQLTLEMCHDECEIKYHRMEAAQALAAILKDPELVNELQNRQKGVDHGEH